LPLRLTTEELARHLVRRVYERTEGRLEWRTVAMRGKAVEAAVELAVERGWLLVDGKSGVSLTHAGRAEVKKGLS
jgi:hypothetical protein